MCQQCVYADADSCKSVADACSQNADCVALSECMVTCVGGDSTKFDGCLQQCNTDHSAGESDYAAVLGCAETACPSDCSF
jgi:hypothetical protein